MGKRQAVTTENLDARSLHDVDDKSRSSTTPMALLPKKTRSHVH